MIPDPHAPPPQQWIETKASREIAKGREALRILARIINDLPQNRDWLDPELERQAREVLSR